MMVLLLAVALAGAAPSSGRLDELERTARRAESARERAEAKEAVALFLCDLEFFDEAQEWLRSAVAELTSAQDAESLYVRCRLEQRLGLYGDALRTSAGLMRAEGQRGRWAARSHARCLERLGRARKLLVFATERAPRVEDEKAWWELVRARALIRLDRNDEATEVCRRVRSAGGREAELAGKLLQALSLRPRVEELAGLMGVGRGYAYFEIVIRLPGFGEKRMAVPRERELTPVLAEGLGEALEAYQSRPLLGVLTGGGPEPVGGVLVRAVDRGSPAEKLGLRSGDIIVFFDGVDLSKWGLFARARLTDLVRRADAGQTVPVKWRRGNEVSTGEVILADYAE